MSNGKNSADATYDEADVPDTDGGGTPDELHIARQEAADTFQSIANLDNIGDTAIVAITFFLTALGTWVTFAYPHLAANPPLRVVVVTITIAAVICTVGSIYYLVASLAPRRFYGSGVGDRFLEHPWLLWRNDDPADLERFSRGEIETVDDLEAAVETWVDDYDQDAQVDSETAFAYSRLLNYKLVARHKARNTAYGLAFLRLAVVFLGLLIVLSLLTAVLTAA